MENEVTLVRVRFGSDSHRTYFYALREDNIKPGDMVFVPVGNDNIQRVAKVVSVETFSLDRLPLPIDKLKTVIGVFNPNDGIKCPVCDRDITADECYEIEMCTEGLGPKNGVPGVADIDLIRKKAELCRKCCFHSKMASYSEDDVIEAHRFSSSNMPALEHDKICGCFYCLEVFSPKEITEYLQDDDIPIDKDGTALCPYCGIDSVIGESSGCPITKEFLSKMKKYWF